MESERKRILTNQVCSVDTHETLVVALEECSELQKAITKIMRYGSEDQNLLLRLADEIADVGIVLDELTVLYNLEELVIKYNDIKMEKLKRIEEENV